MSENKSKTGKWKKGSKAKAVDFEAYAEEKGIKFDIKYGENSAPAKKEEKPRREQRKQETKEREPKTQKKPYSKPSNPRAEMTNKFDQAKQFLNPNVLLGPHMMKEDFDVGQYFPDYAQTFEGGKKTFTVEESIDFYFSVENLNKDVFFRQKLNSEGWVQAEEVLRFKKMKKEEVNIEKLLAAVEKSEVLELKSEGENKYIRNKFWDQIQSQLFSVEEMNARRAPTYQYNQGYMANYGTMMNASGQPINMVGNFQFAQGFTQ